MANKQIEMKDAVQQSVFVPVTAPTVDAGMIVRTLVFVLSLINGIAAMFGLHWNLSVNQEQVYNILSAAILFGSGLWAAWKNNNVTKQARIKQAVANQVVVKK